MVQTRSRSTAAIISSATLNLDRIWISLVNQGLAETTLKQYNSGHKKYLSFCCAIRADPCPASELLLLRFVASQADKVAAGTIQNYLSSVRYLHIIRGYRNPCSDFERLRLLMRALKKRSGKPRQRSPVTPVMLRAIASKLDFNCYNDLLFWCATCLGFFGFLRISEFTVEGSFDPEFDLSIDDVSLLPHVCGAVLAIKHSKTDPFRKGASVTFGATGTPICPVSALTAYLRRRSLAKGPLLRFINGRPLSRTWFRARLKVACAGTGMTGDFTSHSLRIGAATAAAAAGIPAGTIQMLGRWSSDAYKLYIRTPRHKLAEMSQRLVRPA